jgi:hypothetical protein
MRGAIALGLVFGLALTACARDQKADPLAGSLSDLCDATEADAELSDQEAAFFDRAHDAVHELADRATDADPGVAAELLEAKQVVESRFVESFEGRVDPELFDRLIAASNAALAAIEEEPISC